jgi:Dna[CI] antecedent, DciA
MSQYYRFDKSNQGRKAGMLSLGEAIDAYLNALKIKGKFNESYISAHWEKLMGKTISSRTSKVFVSEKKLYIQLTSAPLREELLKAKSLIIRNINEEMGSEVVEEVVFI